MRKSKILSYFLLFLFAWYGVLNFPNGEVKATVPDIPEIAKSVNSLRQENLVQQGREFYQSAQYQNAIQVWEAAAEQFARQGDKHQQAMTLNLLSLAYQKLGEWEAATDALNQSFDILNRQPSDGLLAQALNAQGQLQFLQGQVENALESWEQATAVYEALDRLEGKLGSLLNQTQALEALGLYKRQLGLLNQIRSTLDEVDSLELQVSVLQAVGDALRSLGSLEESQTVLQESLEKAQKLGSPETVAKSLLGLGNTAQSAQEIDQALDYYQQVVEINPSLLTQVQAQLNFLRLALEQRRYSSAETVQQEIRADLQQLPLSQNAVYAQVNLAESLIELQETPVQAELTWAEIEQILATAQQQATALGDRRAQAYTLGRLGSVYEAQKELAKARQLTERALNQAQVLNADDISYRWQWQLGRIQKAQGNTESAIASYTQAVKTLQSLRTDLVSINTDVQFSFRESVEPVYRQLIGLLLDSNPITAHKQTDKTDTSQANIDQALAILEQLQLAELDNFFGDACSDIADDYGRVNLDQVDPDAAVIYPIILADRIEVVLALPGQPSQNYSVAVPQGKVEAIIARLRNALVTPRFSQTFIEGTILPLSQEVYSWIIEPIAPALAEADIKTLVFVADGSLRNIPMAALHDGEKYLLEQYAIALNPSRRLPDPQPLSKDNIKALTAGLSEARQGFSALPGVKQELDEIQTELSSTVFINEAFTTEQIEAELAATDFPIVHLATHGLFSSTAEETFIITWDGKIDVNELESLLKSRNQQGENPIELLVFSACETAQGDERAALGIAGVAVRAGARSTLATLWAVSDQATTEVMTGFYQELTQESGSRVEALRQAQLRLLNQKEYQHPLFWAPYLIVGNWL
jgi:CHAT domain-containing protein